MFLFTRYISLLVRSLRILDLFTYQISYLKTSLHHHKFVSTIQIFNENLYIVGQDFQAHGGVYINPARSPTRDSTKHI